MTVAAASKQHEHMNKNFKFYILYPIYSQTWTHFQGYSFTYKNIPTAAQDYKISSSNFLDLQYSLIFKIFSVCRF